MNTLYRSRTLSSENTEIETISTVDLNDITSDMESQQVNKTKSNHSCNKRSSAPASYIVDYGPIRVRHRRALSQTLATGRRSKYEPVFGEDNIKREMRRAKNRIAARDLKKARDQIEYDLVNKIAELEHEKIYLEDQHKQLEDRKAQLNRAVYNAKQAPLIPLITDMNIPIFFGPQERNDLLFDLQPLLKSIDGPYEFDC